MFGLEDSRLHEDDFLFVPEFKTSLESYRKANGASLSRKTIYRHIVNVMECL